MKRFLPLFAVLLSLMVAPAARADAVALPDTGVDVPALVTAGITKLGTVAVVAVGGAIAFIVIRKAIKWARVMG